MIRKLTRWFVPRRWRRQSVTLIDCSGYDNHRDALRLPEPDEANVFVDGPLDTHYDDAVAFLEDVAADLDRRRKGD